MKVMSNVKVFQITPGQVLVNGESREITVPMEVHVQDVVMVRKSCMIYEDPSGNMVTVPADRVMGLELSCDRQLVVNTYSLTEALYTGWYVG
jgi:hypothetical protein